MKKMKNEKNYMQYVHVAISVFFMFGFGLLPPFSTLTDVGMKLLGIFIGVIYAYSTCDIIWPSLLAIIAFGLSGYNKNMAAAISSAMGSSNVFQIITQYFTTGAIVVYGVSKWIVRKSLAPKIFKGRPKFYTWCFMMTSMLSCIVLPTIPMYLLLYGIWNDIADTCNYEKDSNFRYFGFGAILVSLLMGVSMMPYKSWQLGLATSWANVTGVKINLGMMLMCTSVIGTLVVTGYVFLGSKLFNVDFSTMDTFDVEKLGEESRHLRPRAKRILIVYLITVALALFSGTFRSNALAKFLDGTLTTAGLYCLCTAILMVIPSGENDGQAAIHFNDIKRSDAAVSWPVIFMLAVTIPLATAVTSEGTGVLPWLSELVRPIFDDRSPVFIMVFTVIVMLTLTNVGSNIALGNAMIPIISPFILEMGVNPMFFGCALIYAANFGILLPGSSAPASIFHGRTEIPDVKRRNKATLIGLFLHAVTSIVVFTIAFMLTN